MVEGLKLFALFGAVALIVWSMPEGGPLHDKQSSHGVETVATD